MRNYQLYLQDILEAIEAIESFVAGMDFGDFVLDDKTSSAVMRKFEIMGEATKNIPDEIRQKYPQIPWKQLAGMRDKLIHFYFGVNYQLIWEAIQRSLPPIKLVIQQIITEL